ncbi:bola protein, partial [Jimgerdemannia flammicorona]
SVRQNYSFSGRGKRRSSDVIIQDTITKITATIKVVTPVTQVPSLIMSILPPFARSLSLTIRQWTSLHPTTSASPTLQLQRSYTSAVSNDSDAVTTPSLSEGERHIWDKLTRELNPSKLRVLDVSGGCGSMYAIDITSDAFQGVPMVKQHRIVNEILKEEIKEMHGIQLKTSSK